MNSMPASSDILASARLSSQLPVQRSGTRVTARPDEQFEPNRPILSALSLYIAMRSRMAKWVFVGAAVLTLIQGSRRSGLTIDRSHQASVAPCCTGIVDRSGLTLFSLVRLRRGR